MKKKKAWIFLGGVVALVSSLIVNRVSAQTTANRAPIAVVKARIGNTGAYGSSITVTQGARVGISLAATGSTDPDGWTAVGKGVSSLSGKCEWDRDFNYTSIGAANHLEYAINRPKSASGCAILAPAITFNVAPGTYTYSLLRITDAAGLRSNIATLTVNVVAASATPTPTVAPATPTVAPPTPTPLPPTPTPTPVAGNRAPVAVVTLSVNGGAFANEVTVTKGVPVQIRVSAEGSNDPNDWTIASTGTGASVYQGGKCEWDKDLNYGTLEYSVDNPRTPTDCDLNFGSFTFDIPVGRYPYDILRVTDGAGAQSNIARAYVNVVAPTVTPTPTPVAGNRAPVAVLGISRPWGIGSAELTVVKGALSKFCLTGFGSSDPDGWDAPGTGVVQGGRIEFNLDFQGDTFEIVQTDNLDSWYRCTFAVEKVFNEVAGTYTYPMLRVTDASGAQSNIANLKVTVVDPATYHPPVAVAKIRVLPESTLDLRPVVYAPYASSVTVPQGAAVRLQADGTESTDPDGWTAPIGGVQVENRLMLQTGTCMWNKDLRERRPNAPAGEVATFEAPNTHPVNCSPSLNYMDLGSYYERFTFNEPVGTVIKLPLLKVVDNLGASSIGTVDIIVGPPISRLSLPTSLQRVLRGTFLPVELEIKQVGNTICGKWELVKPDGSTVALTQSDWEPGKAPNANTLDCSTQ